MFCVKCGKPNKPNDVFCAGCGSRLDVDEGHTARQYYEAPQKRQENNSPSKKTINIVLIVFAILAFSITIISALGSFLKGF